MHVPARAKRQAQGVLVNLLYRAKREAKEELVKLRSLGQPT